MSRVIITMKRILIWLVFLWLWRKIVQAGNAVTHLKDESAACKQLDIPEISGYSSKRSYIALNKIHTVVCNPFRV